MKIKSKREKRERRHKRVRAKIKGTSERPRLSVFVSNRSIFLQLVDDETGQTILSANGTDKKNKGTRKERARIIGEELAKRAIEKKIKSAVFDRGGRKYHGIVKEIAEGARKGGLKI